MPTVGIMTFHNSINYGAVLQAYALKKKLSDMSIDAEFIDYHDHARFNKNRPFMLRARHYAWQYIAKLLTGSTRQRRTDSFCQKYLRVSPNKFQSAELLYADPPLYDAYIVGSDQVWNPSCYGGEDPSWFLSFAPEGKRRIAYAPSFGVSKVLHVYEDKFREWLGKIDHLSVREIEGKDIIFQLTQREAEIVLDPTLLLTENEWEEVRVPQSSTRPYILCYFMGNDQKVIKAILDIAKGLSKQTGCDIIRIGQKDYMRLNFYANSVFDAGPSEFLGLIHNASFVVTNSFHGVAFSVNFKKQFFIPVNDKLPPEKALNSRVTTLLHTLDLEQRCVPIGSDLTDNNQLEIDYSKVTEKLDFERMKSIVFLQNALRGV